MRINKRYLAISVGIFASLSILTLHYFGSKNTEIIGNNGKSETNTGNYFATISSVKPSYRNTEAFASCLTTQIEMCSNQVIASSARAKNDLSICEDMSTKEYRDGCANGIISAMALSKGDDTICSKAQGVFRGKCLYDVVSAKALSTKNANICREIDEKRIDLSKNETKTASGIKTPDGQLNSISDSDFVYSSDACINFVVVSLATKKEHTSYCNAIQSNAIRQMCESTISGRFGVTR